MEPSPIIGLPFGLSRFGAARPIYLTWSKRYFLLQALANKSISAMVKTPKLILEVFSFQALDSDWDSRDKEHPTEADSAFVSV